MDFGFAVQIDQTETVFPRQQISHVQHETYRRIFISCSDTITITVEIRIAPLTIVDSGAEQGEY